MSHEKGIETADAFDRSVSLDEGVPPLGVEYIQRIIAAYLAEAHPTSEGAVANQTLTDAQLQDLANIAPVTLAVNGNPRYAITSRHLVYEIQSLRETQRKYERLVRVVGGDLDEALERIEQPTMEGNVANQAAELAEALQDVPSLHLTEFGPGDYRLTFNSANRIAAALQARSAREGGKR